MHKQSLVPTTGTAREFVHICLLRTLLAGSLPQKGSRDSQGGPVSPHPDRGSTPHRSAKMGEENPMLPHIDAASLSLVVTLPRPSILTIQDYQMCLCS